MVHVPSVPIKGSNVIPEGLTFDDVLLLPGYTEVRRQQVDLTTHLHQSITLTLPIISSPMDTVTEADMAITMAEAGGLGIIHRNLGVKEQAAMVKKVKTKDIGHRTSDVGISTDKKGRLLVGAAVGAGADL